MVTKFYREHIILLLYLIVVSGIKQIIDLKRNKNIQQREREREREREKERETHTQREREREFYIVANYKC